MTASVLSDTNIVIAEVAEAALPRLPLTVPAGVTKVVPAAQAAADGPMTGDSVAVVGSFSGAAHGRIVLVVGSDVVSALESSSVGRLEVTAALRPAVESAVAVLGPCTISDLTTDSPAAALAEVAEVAGASAALIGQGGTTVAVVALAIGSSNGPAAAGSGASGSAVGVAGAFSGATTMRGMDLLRDVQMDVTAELGRTRMTIAELMSLSPGAVIELDRAAGAPVDLLVNGQLIARGEVVVLDEMYAVRITHIMQAGDSSDA